MKKKLLLNVKDSNLALKLNNSAKASKNIFFLFIFLVKGILHGTS